VLLWNRTLSDESSTATLHRKVIKDNGSDVRGGSSQATDGAAGKASMYESRRDVDRTRVITEGTVALRQPGRATALSERESAMLERAFVGEMSRGGMRFVDRALVMRVTAASQHRAGGEQQLIETDAMLKFADVMLEVLLVEDRDAPAGYAFDVRAKDLRQGMSVASLYSRALPYARPMGQGAWRAGAEGYEFRQPPPPPPPTMADIGQALARDLMVELTGNWRR